MLIDCDVHEAPWPNREALLECLDEPYRSEVARFGERQLKPGIRYEDGGMRRDTVAPDGRRGGHDPAWTAEDLLDRYGHRFAILSHQTGSIAGMPDPDYAAAMARATNDACLRYWIPTDDRYRMTVMVALQDPALAAQEIDRLGGHPAVVAVGIASSAHRIPLGQRFYWPLFEAAQRHDLPLHIHPSTTSVIAAAASMPTGMATNYLQSHVVHPLFYMSDLVSLVLEGAFEKFPRLRVVLVEGGISWLVHLLWRMDKEFKGLRHEAPFLKRLPSEYVHDHVRLTTQPMEEPRKAEHLAQVFDMIDGDHVVMYASDYPHFDFDEPTVLPRSLSETTRRRILHDNACEFFRLPTPALAETP